MGISYASPESHRESQRETCVGSIDFHSSLRSRTKNTFWKKNKNFVFFKSYFRKQANKENQRCAILASAQCLALAVDQLVDWDPASCADLTTASGSRQSITAAARVDPMAAVPAMGPMADIVSLLRRKVGSNTEDQNQSRDLGSEETAF
ncbi:uncharacterized protein LOC111074741 [Drosophila obscura]|uniref:uncharacterized protein LOC111074741 n=1 Tax=Drosophila obscura TaxID=7282 RepID=UPI001BB21345|nr:uncharacterized protein LOC111074741 [Drosophila obscura]